MVNPLDDAFAAAKRAKTAEAIGRAESARLAEQAAQDWLKAYRQVLETLPHHLDAVPQTVMLAWRPQANPPASITMAGHGQIGEGRIAFGTWDAWCFGHSENYEKGNVRRIYASADCTTVFTAEHSNHVKIGRGLRRKSIAVKMLGPFIDVSNGRHTLELRSYRNSARAGYYVSSSNLPSANQFAQIVAGIEVDRMPTIHWR
jgi:hypothetical protein